jgi:hypothetical protein
MVSYTASVRVAFARVPSVRYVCGGAAGIRYGRGLLQRRFRIDEVLTFAGDVRTVPRGLTVDRQTFRSRKTVGHVAGVAVVLKSRVEVEGCLFRKGIVAGMIDCWG